ncbi:hypothetical protein GJ700_02395 [Duganella sp. FT92W]|uniref:Uncharacterized protein n=2 Tax=Pseudoduganella rivuli TaxID=2666085 RepID=A0A7X2IJC8_9BURK|nr:hypothetical protein [Pseudoduganella rivuli]
MQRRASSKAGRMGITIAVTTVLLFAAAFPSRAIDLVTFAGITGPLVSALTQLAAVTPGVKAIVGVVTFVVAMIALTVLRSFSPVLMYIGVMIFGAVGLVIGGAIMGAVI